MDGPDTRLLPKALLHDHLDGGVRPRTLLELADESGYELPASDEDALTSWFFQGGAGDLIEYLEAFDQVVPLLQSASALERVAYEAAIDLHTDGVVYAEVRFGPSLHVREKLTRHDAIEAVLSGFASARRETGLEVYAIATAMRHQDDSLDVARAACSFADQGVVAFDLAGPEAAYPPDLFLGACRVAREAGLGLTIHAGEHAGPESVWRAIARCAARRIGHGARIIEDCVVEEGRIVALGDLARSVRDLRIPLEISISSNVHTGIAAEPADHPVRALVEAGFNVTLNTDNRLMSGTTASKEVAVARDESGLSMEQLGRAAVAALEAGFGPWSERRLLIDDVRSAYGLT